MEKARAILFLNWTGEDFSHTWGGVLYTFKAGQTMYLEEGLAVHFAKHLANREINKLGKLMNDPLVKVFMEKCYGESFVEQDEKSLETKIVNENPIETETVKIKLSENPDIARILKEKGELPEGDEIEIEIDKSPRFCEFCDSKGVRHKKECPTLIKKDVPVKQEAAVISKGGAEEEFPDLKI